MTTPTQAQIEAALQRARTILANMAQENEPGSFRLTRWPINHEPLRADAKAALPDIDAALTAAAQVGECHPAACRDEQLWRSEIAATIERCTQVADSYKGKNRPSPATDIAEEIAAAIRKLKEPVVDPNIIHPGLDHPGPFPQEEP